MSRNFYVHTHVNFARVNKIVAMYERLRVNVKNERVSTFTFTRDLPCTREFKLHVYTANVRFKQRISQKKNEQIKTAQNNPYG